MARSGYQTVTLDRFGGLDLRRDPLETQGAVRAIDMRNVELFEDGRIRQRPGTTKVYSHSSAVLQQGLFAFPNATAGYSASLVTMDQNTGRLYAFDSSSGAAITNFLPTTPTIPADLFSAVMIGAPGTNNVMYLGVKGAATMVKFDGATFSNVAGVGTFTHMAVQYPDNRLVGSWEPTAAFPSRVSFSGPNTPETFGSTDWVDLLPGEGERIVGMCNWRNSVFVFKQSAFFRFFGNSKDAAGAAVFNYDTVKHGLSTQWVQGVNMCAAGSEGVYFLTRRGVYITDGGPPRKISSALDPLFLEGDYSGYFTDVDVIHGPGFLPIALRYIDGRLFLVVRNNPQVTSSSTGHIFVYDPALDAWMYWGLLNARGTTPTGIAGVTSTTGRQIPYFAATTNVSGSTFRSVISKLDYASIFDQDHDVSTSINGEYRGQFLDAGEPGTMKRIRAFVFEGSLTNNFLNVYRNGAVSTSGTDISGASLTTTPSGGTWPDYRIGRVALRTATRARDFSLEITGTGGWVLNRAELLMTAPRPAGISA